MKVRLTTILLAVLLVGAAAMTQGQTQSQGQAQPQGTPAPPAAPPTKVGIMNVRVAIVNTAEGKQASAQLQSQFAPRQTELDNLRKQMDDAQKKAQLATITDEEKNRLARQYDAWSRAFDRKRQELQEDAQFAENEIADAIGRKMITIVDRYARENGYAVVLDVSAQTQPVVYASNQVDITQDIIRLYDQANPVTAATPVRPAAQPGQTRPPAQPTKPPQR
jgi:outer membrane protein